jgi:hypothetical protein
MLFFIQRGQKFLVKLFLSCEVRFFLVELFATALQVFIFLCVVVGELYLQGSGCALRISENKPAFSGW